MKTKTFVIEENDSNITTFDIFEILYNKKIQLILVALITLVITYSFLFFVPNKYTAKTLLTINDISADPQKDTLGLIAGLGNAPTGAIAKKAEALLTSKSFFEDFVNTRNVVIPLIASNQWDETKNLINTDYGAYNYQVLSENNLTQNNNYLLNTKLMHSAYIEWRKNILKVESDKLTGFYSVSITHHSPYLARDTLEWLIEDINNAMRNLQIRQSNKALIYLENELARNSLPEMKNVVSSLIRENMERKTLASSAKDYVFVVLDPAYKPEYPSSPQKLLIILSTVFIVFFANIFIILFRFFKIKTSNG